MSDASQNGVQVAAMRQQDETVAVQLLFQSSFVALEVLCCGWQANCFLSNGVALSVHKADVLSTAQCTELIRPHHPKGAPESYCSHLNIVRHKTQSHNKP
jgi:hypothetical protein